MEDEQFLGMAAGDASTMLMYLRPRALPVKMAKNCYVHFTATEKGNASFL